jgi:hypothetical protein
MPLPPDLLQDFATFLARPCASIAELLAPEVRAGRPPGLQHYTLWDPQAGEWLFPTVPLVPRLHEILSRRLASPDLKTWAFVLATELAEAGVKDVELAHKTDADRACAVYQTEPYLWRAAPFVRDVGSVGHSEHPTLFGAIYMALRMQYQKLSPGVVDQLFK